MGVSHVILAYDTDYEDYKQLAEVEEKYIQKAKIANTPAAPSTKNRLRIFFHNFLF